MQTVPGKLLDYGTIELEAPGDHPDVRRLVKIWHPHEFYRALRQLSSPSTAVRDPDDVGTPLADPEHIDRPAAAAWIRPRCARR